jgi:hypothetical protein
MKKHFWAVGGLMLLSACLQAQSLNLTAPNGGENWTLGTSRNVTWTFSGYADGAPVKLVLFKDAVDPDHKIGNIVENISIGSGRSGSYSWTVGNYDGGTVAAGSGYYIRVIDMNGTARDESNGPFTISAAAAGGIDLEATDVIIDHTRSLLSVRVRNNLAAFSGWVQIRSRVAKTLAEMWYDRRRLELASGGSDWVNLRNVGFEMFEGECGEEFEVLVNSDNAVAETDTDNNRKIKKLFRYDTHDGNFFPTNRIGSRYIHVVNGATITIRPEDITSRSAANDRVTLNIELVVQNCGGSAIHEGSLVISQLWTYRTEGGREMDGGGEIDRSGGINLDPGIANIKIRTITLNRRDSKVSAYFDAGESGSRNTNNWFQFEVRFSGF